MIRSSTRFGPGVRPEGESTSEPATPNQTLTLSASNEELSQLLLCDRAPEVALAALLDRWLGDGVVTWGGFYARVASGWALAVERGERSQESETRDTRESADSCSDREPTPPVTRMGPADPDAARPRVDGDGHSVVGAAGSNPKAPVTCIPLGWRGNESGRLLLQRAESVGGVALAPAVTVALSLFLEHTSLRSHERVATDFARRLLSERVTTSECELDRFPEIVGRSGALRQMLGLVERAAPTGVSVLIQGESGTGKELIARAIHSLSKRAAGPFVSENCAAFSPTLLESEIFGSEKGSYTGAHQTRAGLLERAQGGTLFLDEIGEMDLRLQSKLLRVLQEREVRRVGGSQLIPVDFRLITATHRDLSEEVTAGRFREDLLFRILVIRIEVPPLRARREDIPLLVEHFVAQFARDHGVPVPKVDKGAMRHLMQYAWPGNIRELRNEMERALALTPDRMTMESLSERLQEPFLPRSVARRVRRELGTDLRGLERAVLGGVIREVLEETGGNKTRAAEILGLPKTSLYRRLEWYGIDVDVGNAPSGENPVQRLMGDG